MNDSQKQAILYAKEHMFSAIEAPPGTGKTTVASALVHDLLTLNPNWKILICAPSNVAAASLAVNVVKRFKEESSDELKLVRMYAQYIESGKFYHYIPPEIETTVLHRNEGKPATFLDSANVICCTCIGAGDPRLAKFKFDAIVVDEGTLAMDPEILVPILKANENCKICVFGDRKQLSPIVKSRKNNSLGLNRSFFVRMHFLYCKDHQYPKLNVQYRMHPSISKFPLMEFYDEQVSDGITPEDREINPSLLGEVFPNADHPFVFISHAYEEKQKEIPVATHGNATKPSFVNEGEGIVICSYVEKLIQFHAIAPERIGIIAMYKAQAEALNETTASKVEVGTVDSFQGREKDFIIVSCVRSNKKRSIGFLSNRRRINVALTRARYGLIIVGNETTLSKNSTFEKLLNFHRMNNALLAYGSN